MTTSIADIKRVFIVTSAWIDLMNSTEPDPILHLYHLELLPKVDHT